MANTLKGFTMKNLGLKIKEALTLRHLKFIHGIIAAALFVTICIQEFSIWRFYADYELDFLMSGNFDRLEEFKMMILTIIISNIIYQATLFILLIIPDRIYGRFKSRRKA